MAVINRNGALEMLDGLFGRLEGALVQEMPADEIFRIGFRIDHPGGFGIAYNSLPQINSRTKGIDDSSGNFVLDGKNIDQFPVIALGPEMEAAMGIDKLRGDPHPIAAEADAAFKDMSNAQGLPDFRNAWVSVPEIKGRGAGRDLKAFDPGQRVQQLFRDAVGEILFIAVGAQVLERQHSD